MCADRSSDLLITGCGDGSTCPLSQQNTAFCDQCQFDTSNKYCGHVTGYYNTTSGDSSSSQTGSTKICYSAYSQILLNTNNPYLFKFVDTGLAPHTRYEYYVVARNLVGNTTSLSSATLTSMARPENLQSPVPTVLSSDRITIVWSPPVKPNGVITKYELFRTKWSTKQETLVYTGLEITYTDEVQLEAYTGYMYTLSVCTNLCTNATAVNLVYTEESAPEQVHPPDLTPLSSKSIRVEWKTPGKPNGVITHYNVTMRMKDGGHTSILQPNSLGEAKSHVVSSLEPFTNYTFRVEACTRKGCSASPEASVMTFEAVPEGMTSPRILVLSATSTNVEWDEPKTPNGIIKYYVIRRNGTVVFNTTLHVYEDRNVRPAQTYHYDILAYNEAGSSASPPLLVTTPESSPEGIGAPSAKPLTSVSINVTWGNPSTPNGVITSYYILHQEVGGPITRERNTGAQYWYVITGLKPFTFYNVRVEACTNIGCGVGSSIVARTNESRPFGQDPPTLIPQTSTMVEIKWKAPTTPNGYVTEYVVERRDGDVGMPFQIYVGPRLQYIDSQLKPYTTYKYRVHSRNGAGNAVSSWITTRTPSAPPTSIQPPRVDSLNGTAVKVKWSKPGVENGVIIRYVIRYRMFSQLAGTSFEEVCCFDADVFETMLNVFKPATK